MQDQLRKKKNNDETTELKNPEFNNKSVAMSHHKEKDRITKNNTFVDEKHKLRIVKSRNFAKKSQKEKIKRVIQDYVPIDNLSRSFILRDLALPGTSFINNSLEF